MVACTAGSELFFRRSYGSLRISEARTSTGRRDLSQINEKFIDPYIGRYTLVTLACPEWKGY